MISKSLKKIDIYKKFYEEVGISESTSKKILNDLIDILKICIRKIDLNLKNIGTFKIVKKNKRVGRNPKTKEEFIISERNSIIFIVSKNLLKKINQN